VKRFGQEDIFTSFSDISISDYANGICIALEAIEGQVFHPNILFLPFTPDTLHKRDLTTIYQTAQRHQVGVVLFAPDREARLGSHKDIHIRIPSEAVTHDLHETRSFDLAMLISYTLYKNRDTHIKLCIPSNLKRHATDYLQQLIAESRFPTSTQIAIYPTDLQTAIQQAPQGDLEIVAL
jgi:hypothetical protein